MRQIRAVVLGLLFASVMLTAGKVWAHATCTNSNCCSPHGQWSSDTGCDFGVYADCVYNGTYWRDFRCPSYSEGAAGCGANQHRCGVVYVNENHVTPGYSTVQPYYAFCQDDGQPCW